MSGQRQQVCFRDCYIFLLYFMLLLEFVNRIEFGLMLIMNIFEDCELNVNLNGTLLNKNTVNFPVNLSCNNTIL